MTDAHGEVVGGMRPGGRVRVNDEWVDARTAGEFLDVGTPVRFIRCDGGIWLVREER